jgi:hypothetical protein
MLSEKKLIFFHLITQLGIKMQANNSSEIEVTLNNNSNNEYELFRQFMAFRLQQQNQQQNQERTEEWINQVPAQIDPNDSISLTSLKTGDQNFNSDITDLKKFFDIPGNFLSKRELVLAILAKDINWNEVSKDPNITELVLDTFSNKIQWVEVLFTIPIHAEIIKKYSKYFKNGLEDKRFWRKFNDEVSIVEIVMEIMDKKFQQEFLNKCFEKDFAKSFELLVHNNDYDKDIQVYEKSPKCLQVLINNNYVIPTNEHLKNAIKENNYHIIELLLKDERVQPTYNHLKIAIEENKYQIVEFLLKDGRIQPTDGHLCDALRGYNFYQIIEILLKDGRVQPTIDHLQKAINSRYYQIVEILLKDKRIHPNTIYLDRVISSDWSNTINILLKDGRIRFTYDNILVLIKNDYCFHNDNEYNHMKQDSCYCDRVDRLLKNNQDRNLIQGLFNYSYTSRCSINMKKIINKYHQ